MAEGHSLLSSIGNDNSEHGSSWSDDILQQGSKEQSQIQQKKVELIKKVVRNSIETIKQTIKNNNNYNNNRPSELYSNNINNNINNNNTVINPSHLTNNNNNNGSNSNNNNNNIVNKVSYCSSENILLWKNVGKWTDSTKTLRLLQNVSGRVKAGEIVAIMGHSGCGKSTLMNLLSGHYTKGMEGSIFLNDERLTPALRRKIAYVTQVDIFHENLTVREQLLYTAKLYLSGTHTNDEILDIVTRVLNELHILYISDVQIKFLSGGQRKRCSIGSYLVSMPEFLLLDEPMSGLDSSAMSSLLGSLRVQAQSNVAILMTIHQPSTSVFYSFDWLLFLGGRGRVVYWGKPYEVMSYLAYYEFYPIYGPNSNPADFLMDLVCQEIYTYDGRTAFQFLVDTWDETAPQPTDANTPADLIEHPTTSIKYSTSLFTQLGILMGRSWRLSKAKILSYWKIFEGMILSIVTGLLWYNTPYEESSLENKGGYFFFLIASFFYAAVFGSLVSFPLERPVYIKETRAAQYSPAAFYFSWSLIESPARLILPIIYISISFSLVRVNPDPLAIFGLISSLCLMTLVGEALGLFIGLMILELEQSLVVGNLGCIILMLLGGFYTESLPWFVDWVKYISPFYYTYELCLQNDFNRPVPCVNGLTIPNCVVWNESSYQYVLLDEVSKDEVWNRFGLNRSIGYNFGIMFVFFVILKFLGYLALKYRRHNKTNE